MRAAGFEAVANGDPGAPLGRELEIARAAEVHQGRARSATSSGSPRTCTTAPRTTTTRTRAGFTEFDPFWEFVGGPLHAGTFGPSELDRTFGPEVKFIGIPPG